MEAGHEQRPYLDSLPKVRRIKGAGPGSGATGNHAGFIGGSFVHQVLSEAQVAIVKRLFGVFMHMRSNPKMHLEDIVKVSAFGHSKNCFHSCCTVFEFAHAGKAFSSQY